MRVVEKAHHIDFQITSGSNLILPIIRKAYPDIKIYYDNDSIPVEESSVYEEGKAYLAEPGMKLFAYRSKLGLTQKSLAEQSGVKREAISLIENGKRPIGLNVAKKLAAPLGIDYKELL